MMSICSKELSRNHALQPCRLNVKSEREREKERWREINKAI
jgi:hypothetical protein